MDGAAGSGDARASDIPASRPVREQPVWEQPEGEQLRWEPPVWEQPGGEQPRGEQPEWEQEAAEPDKWFARFAVFRALGPRRTLAEAYRLVASAEGLRGKRPDQRWTRMAQTWRWRARAAAWDAAQRERLRRLEAERRFDAREARLGMIDHLLEAVFRVLAAAELDKLAREEARDILPTLRAFFKDLLAAQRAEWTVAAQGNPPPAEVTLRADDLLRAQIALAQWQAARAKLLAAQDEE